MIDYTKWPHRRFNVGSLKLDDLNPRLSENKNGKRLTQRQIIDHLVLKEKAYELAKDIAILGYFVNEEPIVYKEGSKYVVLEGNRRVAACKILINPDLLDNKTRRKNIKEAAQDFNIDLIRKLEVRVAPSREAADVLIMNRHTEGASIEKWDKVKQDRFFYNSFRSGESVDKLSEKFNYSKAKVNGILKRYNMYQEILKLELTQDEIDDVENESKFSMSTMERFYASKYGKNFLGIRFDESGMVIHALSKDEYNGRLKKIVSDISNDKLNTRIYGDDKLQLKYVRKLYDEEKFNEYILRDEKYQEEYIDKNNAAEPDVDKTTTEHIPKVKKTSAKKNKLIPQYINWETGIKRLDDVFGEIKKANLKTQFNSAAILFRSYLDMISYQYLLKTKSLQELVRVEQQELDINNANKIEAIKKYLSNFGLSGSKIDEKELTKALKLKKGISSDWIPSLKIMLDYISKSDSLLANPKLKQVLSSYLKGNDYFDHSDFNSHVHNEYVNIKNGDDLKKCWEQMFPLLEHINLKLTK